MIGHQPDFRPLLSIIVPVFNEERTIVEVLRRLAALDLKKEVIVVNDGSTDTTRSELEKASHLCDLVIHCQQNRGKGAAIRAGLARARGHLLAIQDADLELDPRELMRLIRPVQEGKASVVYGSRFMRRPRGIPALSLFGNKFLTLLTNLMFQSHLTDMETCYKVFRTDVLRRIRLNCRGFEFEPEVTAKVLRAGFRIAELPISYRPRTGSEGKKINWRDGLKAVYYLLRYSVAN